MFPLYAIRSWQAMISTSLVCNLVKRVSAFAGQGSIGLLPEKSNLTENTLTSTLTRTRITSTIAI